MRIARENRPELKARDIRIGIAETADEKIRARWKPQVSASADLRWNTQLQSNVLPIGAFGVPGVPADATKTVKFGTPFNNALSLQAEQKILDFNRNIDKKINANTVENQRNLLEQESVTLRYAVAEAYYAALWQEERVRLAQQALDRAQVLLEEGQARFRDGALLQNELDRLALDAGNARLALANAGHDRLLSIQNLVYQLALPPETQLELADGFDQLQQANSSLPPARPGERPEIRGEQIAAQANELNRQKELLQMRPSLSAYGNYTLLQLHEQPNPFAANTWFPFSYLGLRLSVPIYDGKQARLAARDFERQQQINQLNAQKLAADFSFETEKYRTALLQAEASLQQARENIRLAGQILETDQLRLRQGVILPADLKNSEYARQQAENNYLSALYDWLLAGLNWRRASGNL